MKRGGGADRLAITVVFAVVSVALAVSCGQQAGPDGVVDVGGDRHDQVSPTPPTLVVLYVLDALRADHVGDSGWTPILDRLADQGATFNDYTSTAASTKTFVKNLFTGSFWFDGGGLTGDVETLAEVMRAAGYRTVGISGNGYVSDKYGMDRGFDSFEMVYPLARGADPATYVNRNAENIHRRLLERLDEAEPATPTFVYLHSIHPHTPYSPPHEMRDELCGGIPSTIDGMSPTLLAIRDGEIETSEADRRRLGCLYAAGLRYNDAEIGELLGAIGGRYASDEVLFIVTSDHGEEFFDHGGVLHGHTLYDELLRVPLIFYWPGIVPPTVVDTASDTMDLHVTLRALVGREHPPAGAGGRSLWSSILGRAGDRRGSELRFAVVPTLPGGMMMVRSGRYKLVFAPREDGGPGMGLGIGRSHSPEYLFDLRTDPMETVNLIGTGVSEEDRLRARLEEWIDSHRARRQSGSEVELDPETKAHLEAIGYVE